MFACLALLVTNLNIDNAFATWKIENDTLIIHNESPGELLNGYIPGRNYKPRKHVLF